MSVISAICRSGYFQLRQLCPVPRSLIADAAKTIVHAFIACRLDYCNSLLHGITDSLFRRLQSVQHAAACLITGTRRQDHITLVLRDLHWLLVRRRVDYKLALLLVCKSLHSLATSYLADDCILASSDKFRRSMRSADVDTRHMYRPKNPYPFWRPESADVDTCIVPRTHTRFGDWSFPAAGRGSGTACRRNCDGLTLSLVNSVDY